MRSAFGLGAAVTVWMVTSGACLGQVVGSAAIDRPLNDSSTGLSLIYHGTSQPLMGNGAELERFRYFVGRELANDWITPFMLEVTGPDSYEVVAIGESRQSGDEGLHSFAFVTLAGDATTVAGREYTFGYQNRRYESDGAGGVDAVAGTNHPGTIPFDGYSVFTDNWSYAHNSELEVGAVFGDGGFALNALGFAGRIYSANAIFGGGSDCAADLNGDGTLDFFDVQAFLGHFAGETPQGDFNDDGIYDFFDVQAFLQAFAAGCP